jgi:hypothetical protein
MHGHVCLTPNGENSLSQYLSQSLDDIRNHIDAVGQFEYEFREDGLKIFGFK